jgi:hypothetical protein
MAGLGRIAASTLNSSCRAGIKAAARQCSTASSSLPSPLLWSMAPIGQLRSISATSRACISQSNPAKAAAVETVASNTTLEKTIAAARADPTKAAAPVAGEFLTFFLFRFCFVFACADAIGMCKMLQRY